MGFEMKTYTKKQAGVIYAAMKRGDIEVGADVISEMYDYAGGVEIYNTNSMAHVEEFALTIKAAIDAIFENDYTTANKELARLAA